MNYVTDLDNYVTPIAKKSDKLYQGKKSVGIEVFIRLGNTFPIIIGSKKSTIKKQLILKGLLFTNLNRFIPKYLWLKQQKNNSGTHE